jgi:hypothetical protein
MDNLQQELAELKGFIADLKADRAAAKEKEKREAWTKYVSLTIVIIAVIGSVASQMSGKFGSRTQMSQAQASDQWNLYQARSIKGHLLEVTIKQMAKTCNTNDPEVQKIIKGFEIDTAKYNQGKIDSDKIARAFEKTRDESGVLGGRIGYASQLIYLAIALSSMCLLTKKKPLWLLAIALAVAGGMIMISVNMAEKSGMAKMPVIEAPPTQKTAAGT